jgi:phospholipid N-methyltransferase
MIFLSQFMTTMARIGTPSPISNVIMATILEAVCPESGMKVIQ